MSRDVSSTNQMTRICMLYQHCYCVLCEFIMYSLHTGMIQRILWSDLVH